jgi:hypothetical protein
LTYSLCFKIIQIKTKNEKDMRLELERGVEKIEANYHSSSFYVFWLCSFASDAQRTFVTLQFVRLMT